MAIHISPRINPENYPLRGHADRESDWVERFTRTFGTRSVDFVRIRWADGGITVRAESADSATPLHEFTS